MSDEFYRPTIIKPKDISIDGTDYNDDLNIIKEGNTIKVTMDQDVMIQRVSHEIYSDHKSGVRELINNEYRACRQARDKYNAKPHVDITINKSTRNLTIDGIDSLGISVRVFDKVLRNLGVSGNNSADGGNEIGQFGMGFASYTTLSEVVTVETYSREDNQQYAFLGDRGIDFKILPKPDRETFGTKISVTCKEEVSFKEVIEKIESCAMFSTIPTNIIVEDSGDPNDWHDEIQEGYITPPQYKTGKEYVNLNTDAYSGRDSIKWFRVVHIDTEDYEFFGNVAVGQRIMHDDDNIELRLVNTPIDMGGRLDDITDMFVSAYFNIKNERKYPPTADRDRLKESSLDNIISELQLKVKEHFNDMCIESLKDYQSSLDKAFYDNINSFEKVMSKESYDISYSVIRGLNKRFVTHTGRSTTMSSLIKTGGKVFVLKSLRTDLMSRINTHKDCKDTAVTFIRFRPNADDNGTVYALFNEADFTLGEQFIKDNKIKTPKKDKSITSSSHDHTSCVLFHQGNHGYRDSDSTFGMRTAWGKPRYSTTVGEINRYVRNGNENFLKDPNKYKKQDNYMIVSKANWYHVYEKVLYKLDLSYMVMKPHTGLDETIPVYEKLLISYKKKRFHTLGNKTINLHNVSDKKYKHYLLTQTTKAKELSHTFSHENLNMECDVFKNHLYNNGYEEGKIDNEEVCIIFAENNTDMVMAMAMLLSQNEKVDYFRPYNIQNCFQPISFDIISGFGEDNYDTLINMEKFRKTVSHDKYELLIHAINGGNSEDVEEYMETIRSLN